MFGNKEKMEMSEKPDIKLKPQNSMSVIDPNKLSPPIGFIFTKQELEIILNYLGKRPWVEVTDVMDMIRMKLGNPKILNENGSISSKIENTKETK